MLSKIKMGKKKQMSYLSRIHLYGKKRLIKIIKEILEHIKKLSNENTNLKRDREILKDEVESLENILKQKEFINRINNTKESLKITKRWKKLIDRGESCNTCERKETSECPYVDRKELCYYHKRKQRRR